MAVPVRVAGELTLWADQTPKELLDVVKGDLTLPNVEKEVALREHVFGAWSMPDTIALWRSETLRGQEVIRIPRGSIGGLVAHAREFSVGLELDDHRVAPHAPAGYYGLANLFPSQVAAITDLLKAQQGIWEAPPAAGKTVGVLGALAISGLSGLVVCDKANLVDQWRRRANEHLGLSLDLDDERAVGIVGDGVWVEKPLTIALRQSLWSRLGELDALRWWDRFGLSAFDECHHLSGETLQEIARRCTSTAQIGVSATPAKSDAAGRMVYGTLGPLVHRTPKSVLRAEGRLVMPKIVRVFTGFETDFWDTHDSDARGECSMPNCPKAKAGKVHSHRNNYQTVLKKVKEDEDRNRLIASIVASQRGHSHLIPSRHLNHLDMIERFLRQACWDGPIFKLRGEENAKGLSREITAEIEQAHEAVVLSTVADEALDIPPLDRLHIVFPMRQVGGVIQLVGRIERVAEGKEDAIVYDYTDATSVLVNQAQERDRAYRMEAYPMENITAADVLGVAA